MTFSLTHDTGWQVVRPLSVGPWDDRGMSHGLRRLHLTSTDLGDLQDAANAAAVRLFPILSAERWRTDRNGLPGRPPFHLDVAGNDYSISLVEPPVFSEFPEPEGWLDVVVMSGGAQIVDGRQARLPERRLARALAEFVRDQPAIADQIRARQTAERQFDPAAYEAARAARQQAVVARVLDGQ